jgi:hypothetical protein
MTRLITISSLAAMLLASCGGSAGTSGSSDEGLIRERDLLLVVLRLSPNGARCVAATNGS